MKNCMAAMAAAVACTLTAVGEPEDGRIEGYDKLGTEVQLLQDEVEPRLERNPELVRDDEDEDRDRDEDARDLVETVMMVRMSEELNLDDEQTVMMVRRLRELKQEMMQMRRERWALYRELKDALRETPERDGIQPKLDELLDYDRRLETFKQDRLEVLSEGLTTPQRAKLYIFLCEFENDMRHLVHRAQGREWRKYDGDRDDDGDGDRDEKDWRDRWHYDRDDVVVPDSGGGGNSN